MVVRGFSGASCPRLLVGGFLLDRCHTVGTTAVWPCLESSRHHDVLHGAL
jgi:hypothetical protein